MSIVVPNDSRKVVLEDTLNQTLTLKLFSNNYTPIATSSAGDFTEVAGGGYVAKSLLFGGWSVTSAAPAVATYTFQDFAFTGATNAPGTVYGYYIVDSLGVLVWAERFDAGVLPFSPVLGSLIRITPRLEAA